MLRRRVFSSIATLRLIFSVASLLVIFVPFAEARGTDEADETNNTEDPLSQEAQRIEIPDSNQSMESSESIDIDGVWALVEHPIDESLERGISSVIAQRYIPVGIERAGESMRILYARSSRVQFDRWILEDFPLDSSINEELSARILNGWLPMGISIIDNRATVLLVQGESSPGIEGWRLHQASSTDVQGLISVLEQYRTEGFIPYGVSIDETNEVFWFLMIENQGTETDVPARVVFNGFLTSDVREGITKDVNNGLLPWGYTVGQRSAYLVYLF